MTQLCFLDFHQKKFKPAIKSSDNAGSVKSFPPSSLSSLLPSCHSASAAAGSQQLREASGGGRKTPPPLDISRTSYSESPEKGVRSSEGSVRAGAVRARSEVPERKRSAGIGYETLLVCVSVYVCVCVQITNPLGLQMAQAPLNTHTHSNTHSHSHSKNGWRGREGCSVHAESDFINPLTAAAAAAGEQLWSR